MLNLDSYQTIYNLVRQALRLTMCLNIFLRNQYGFFHMSLGQHESGGDGIKSIRDGIK